MLESVEEAHYRVTENGAEYEDIQLRFRMSPAVLDGLRAVSWPQIDILIVPLPVRMAIREAFEEATRPLQSQPSTYQEYKEVNDLLVLLQTALEKARTCRVADRVTKTVAHNKFCV